MKQEETSQYLAFFSDCNEDQAKKKYRELQKLYHPDGENGNLFMSQEINRAYNIYLERLKKAGRPLSASELMSEQSSYVHKQNETQSNKQNNSQNDATRSSQNNRQNESQSNVQKTTQNSNQNNTQKSTQRTTQNNTYTGSQRSAEGNYKREQNVTQNTNQAVNKSTSDNQDKTLKEGFSKIAAFYFVLLLIAAMVIGYLVFSFTMDTIALKKEKTIAAQEYKQKEQERRKQSAVDAGAGARMTETNSSTGEVHHYVSDGNDWILED